MPVIRLYCAKRPTKDRKARKVWQLRWIGTDGVRYCESIRDANGVVYDDDRLSKRDAEKVRRERQGQMDNDIIPVNRPERMTLEAFIAHDQQAIAGDVRPSTMDIYDHSRDHAFAVIGKATPLSSITRADVGKLKATMRGKGLSEATIAKTIRTLRAAFNRAITDKLIRENPFAGQAGGKIQSKAKRIYEPHELAAMIEATGDDVWWSAFIRLSATSGLRLNESLNLLWSDVNAKVKTVTVSRKQAGTFAAGDAVLPIFAWESKSHEERTVPVPDDTLLALHRLKAKAGPSPYVFLDVAQVADIARRLGVNAAKGRRRTELIGGTLRAFHGIQAHAKALLQERSAEPVAWPLGTIHDLRKTFGTQTARAGVPMHVLQRLMGHSTITVTAQYYLGMTTEDADNVRASMDAMMRGHRTDAQQTRDVRLTMQNTA